MYICPLGVSIYLTVILFKAINVVECPEFRALLLLLRSDMKQSVIPHRTKLRELIIHDWRRHYGELKDDLAVCLSFQALMHANIMCSESFRSDFIHDRRMV
jgi:hypothetical protein